MRENNLLSPHRCRRRGGNPHVGEIITHAPNLMWGTDLRAAAATLRADRVLSPGIAAPVPSERAALRRSREHIGRTPMPIHATINERTLRRTFREQVKGKRGLTVFDRAS